MTKAAKDEDALKQIGARIRERRLGLLVNGKPMTQGHLAGLVGVVPHTVSRWERGEQHPSESLVPLAHALECSVEYLTSEPAPEAMPEAVEVDVPESFLIWKEQLAPTMAPLLTPEIEAQMIGTNFRYSREDAARWQVIYGEVLAEIRGRRAASLAQAQAEDTAAARAGLKKSGAMKPPPLKKR